MTFGLIFPAVYRIKVSIVAFSSQSTSCSSLKWWHSLICGALYGSDSPTPYRKIYSLYATYTGLKGHYRGKEQPLDMLLPDAESILAGIAAPISDTAPGGIDLRETMGVNSLYSSLRDARSSARMQERISDDDPERSAGIPEEWRAVEKLALEALTTQSKDLEVASFLTESLTRLYGLSGLALGTKIITVLVEKFWSQDLYPPLEADDPEARTFAITGLSGADRDGSLIQPLRKTVLFEFDDGRTIAAWEYERARSRAATRAQGEHVAVIHDDLPSLEDMEKIATGSGNAFLTDLAREADSAYTAWQNLHSVLETACRESSPVAEPPSMGRVTHLLEEIRAATHRYVKLEDLVQKEDPEPVAETEDAALVEHTPSSKASPPKAPARPTRTELLDAAMEIAQQFRKMEPHSPFSYTLENAIRRARLSLPDLLREVVMDDSSRAEILTRLGIQELDL
ncbi:type VI secretion system protein TssA [Swingsia samuiensis]|uniref:Type VI secretion system protein TssA n=1 Tax=Swingsia samuiensis TaxID=1293412 RepID=A0A4Y6UJZ5_9PROT|nr:type VI secretion system protein TssA [Swingsia samuiensis]QDH16325.1 type VI secretion system protein TssA [Swingsia samuiensis]